MLYWLYSYRMLFSQYNYKTLHWLYGYSMLYRLNSYGMLYRLYSYKMLYWLYSDRMLYRWYSCKMLPRLCGCKMLCRQMVVRCSPLCVSIHGHSTHSSHASQHIRYGDMLFLSEALSTWVNGKQLSCIMVSVVFHALRVAKHVPRLRARRATPVTGKTRLLRLWLSWELILLNIVQVMLLMCFSVPWLLL